MNLYSDDNPNLLIPAEYNVRGGAAFDDGWPTILYKNHYLPAETTDGYYKVPTSGSVFRCPSGLPAVYSFNPTSREDPERAKAWPFGSTTKKGKSSLALLTTLKSCVIIAFISGFEYAKRADRHV